MLIQNPGLANKKLTMRFTRDENGNPMTLQGSAQGVFDVPETDGAFLLRTPGWGTPRAARSLEEAELPPVLKPKLAAPAPKVEADGEEEAVKLLDSIKALRSKAEAREFGAEHGVTLDEDMKLGEMKERLEAELFESDGEETDAEEKIEEPQG